MALENVYSVCGMCTVRCPIQAEVENGEVRFLQGNPHVPAMKGAVCPRGAAGIALVKDRERPQAPMIREGARGEGKWRTVTWDEALDYVAGRLSDIKEKYGARGIAFSDRGGPFRDFHRAFLKGLGTPNYCNHDTSCARNVQHACISVTGMGRKDLVYDLKNARHVVLQLRNIFESINVQEVNNLMDAMEAGCKLTVIDIRGNISASKADRFFMVRPGTDYAFNLAVIHEILAKELYDKDYVEKYFKDFKILQDFRQALHPRMGRDGNRRAGGVAPPVRPGTRRRGPCRDLASGMDDRPVHHLLLCQSHHLHHQRPSGGHRRQGRPARRQQARGRGPQGAQVLPGSLPQARGEARRRRRLALPPPGSRAGAAPPDVQGHGDRRPLPGEGVYRLSPRSPHGIPRPRPAEADLRQPRPHGLGDLFVVGHGLVFRRGPAPVALPGAGEHRGRQGRTQAPVLRPGAGRRAPLRHPGRLGDHLGPGQTPQPTRTGL